MPFSRIVRIFSIPPVAAAALVLFAVGYGYEVHATLSSGLPQISGL